MKEYEISYLGDASVSDVHHIGISHDGNYYNVIFGEYSNGGFFSIPNWNCGGELANFWDKYWNENSIYKALKRKKASKIIALAIAEYMENKEI